MGSFSHLWILIEDYYCGGETLSTTTQRQITWSRLFNDYKDICRIRSPDSVMFSRIVNCVAQIIDSYGRLNIQFPNQILINLFTVLVEFRSKNIPLDRIRRVFVDFQLSVQNRE